eukprot:UN01270
MSKLLFVGFKNLRPPRDAFVTFFPKIQTPPSTPRHMIYGRSLI